MDPNLLEAVMGPIWAALGAIGHKALTDAEDDAAKGIVGLGHKLLARLRRRGGSTDPARAQLEAAAVDVANAPDDEDFRAALRGQVKKALAGTDSVDDPSLVEDLTKLLEAAGVQVSAEGAGSVAVHHNEGIISTGKHAKNSINRWGRA
ncbi:hypothetical protein [Actinospica robiniae]|nr:hypothetical protein [Actinospica robiniae]